MIDRRRREVHGRAHAAVVGIAVIRLDRHVSGFAGVGRNPAIGATAVVEVFVAERDLRPVAWEKRERWRDALAFEFDALSEAVGFLINAIEAQCELVIERLIEVRADAAVVPRTALKPQFAQWREARLLRHPIDDASGSPAPEDHRVRALQRLDALEVVEIAVVLHFVALVMFGTT